MTDSIARTIAALKINEGKTLGRCCYGGVQTRADCASCGAWKPINEGGQGVAEQSALGVTCQAPVSPSPDHDLLLRPFNNVVPPSPTAPARTVQEIIGNPRVCVTTEAAAPAPASRFGDVTVVDGVAGAGGASAGGTAGPPWSGDGGTRPYTPTPAAPAPDAVCDWHQDGEDSETWQTGCGHYFTIIDGTPTDNEFRHCCFCGHLLAQHLHENDYDDE